MSEVSSSSDAATGSSSGTSSGSDKESPPPPGKKTKSCASAAVSAEPQGKEPGKKRSRDSQVTNGAVASRPSTSKLARPVSELEEGERDKALEMAEKRKVYQSLFSSNAAERPKEQTSNWVTFFPYH